MTTTRLFISYIFSLCWASLFGVSAHAGDEGSPIKIGAVYALSGWGAPGGQPELVASQMAIDKVNATGGIAGRPLQLVVEDNHSDYGKTASAIQKLTSVDQVSVILGPNWTEFSEVAAPIAQSKGVVLLSASGNPVITKGRDLVFTTLPAFQFFTKPLAERILAQKHRKIALIKSENPYCQALADSIASQLTAGGTPLGETFSFNTQANDFRSVILRIKRGNFDGVVLSLLEDGSMPTFFKQARELRLAVPIYATNTLTTDGVILKDPSIAEGAVSFRLIMYATDEFIAEFKRRARVDYVDTAPRAYDNVMLLRKAMEQCGLEAKEIARCLQLIEHDAFVGKIRFNSERNINPTWPISEVVEVKGGRILPITD